MSTMKYKPEQIVNLLRQIEVEIANGKTTPQACRDAQITAQTYYRWRKEYGGLKLDQAKRLKELEKENSRLKRLVTDIPPRSRCCAMWRRETSKPRAAALCGRACAGRVRTLRDGMPAGCWGKGEGHNGMLRFCAVMRMR